MERDEEKVVIGRKGNDRGVVDAASLANSRWREAVFRACGAEGRGGWVLSHRLPPEQFCIMRGQHVSQTLTQSKDHAADTASANLPFCSV